MNNETNNTQAVKASTKSVRINSAISATNNVQVAPQPEVVDMTKYQAIMADPTIYKQYCLKHKVGPNRITRVLLALKEELTGMDLASAVVKFQTIKRDVGSLTEALAKRLGLSESTVAEELSEVVCKDNRNAIVGFVNSAFHSFLEIGDVCYYKSSRNNFLKAVNTTTQAVASNQPSK